MSKDRLDVFGIKKHLRKLYTESGAENLVNAAVEKAPVLGVLRRFIPFTSESERPRGELPEWEQVPTVEEIDENHITGDKAKDTRDAKKEEPSTSESDKESNSVTHKLATEVDHLRSALEESKLQMLGQTTQLRNEVHDLEKRNAELLEKIVQLTQKERKLSKSVLDAQFQGSGVKADKERLEIEFQDLRRKVEESGAEIQKTEEERRMAEKRLQEKEQRVVQLQEELKKTQQNVNSILEKGKEAENSRTVAEKHLQENAKKLSKLETELAEARRSVEEIQAERRRVRESKNISQVDELQSAVAQLQSAVFELRDVVEVDEDQLTSEDLDLHHDRIEAKPKSFDNNEKSRGIVNKDVDNKEVDNKEVDNKEVDNKEVGLKDESTHVNKRKESYGEPEVDEKDVPDTVSETQDEPIKRTFVREGPMGDRRDNEYDEDSSPDGAPDMPSELTQPQFPSEDGDGRHVVMPEDDKSPPVLDPNSDISSDMEEKDKVSPDRSLLDKVPSTTSAIEHQKKPMASSSEREDKVPKVVPSKGDTHLGHRRKGGVKGVLRRHIQTSKQTSYLHRRIKL